MDFVLVDTSNLVAHVEGLKPFWVNVALIDLVTQVVSVVDGDGRSHVVGLNECNVYQIKR